MKLFKKNKIETVEETLTQKKLKELKNYVNLLESNHKLGLITNSEYQYELMMINDELDEIEYGEYKGTLNELLGYPVEQLNSIVGSLRSKQ